MRIASYFCMVLGFVALFFCAFGFVGSGSVDLVPDLVGAISILVGLIGIQVRRTLERIEEVEHEISAKLKRNQSGAERLREEGLLSSVGRRASNAEIDEILA